MVTTAAQLVGSITNWEDLFIVRGKEGGREATIEHLFFLINLNLFKISIKCVLLMAMMMDNKLLFDRIVVEPSM